MASYKAVLAVIAILLSVVLNMALVFAWTLTAKMAEQNIQEASVAGYHLGRMLEVDDNFPVKEQLESLPVRLQLVDVTETSVVFRLRGLNARLLVLSSDDSQRFTAKVVDDYEN